jgi:2-methylcitrate dehydratase
MSFDSHRGMVEGQCDALLLRLASYAANVPPPSGSTLQTAVLCLADAVGCAVASLADRDCMRRIGPWVAGSRVDGGVPVWGTSHVLDPIKAAHDISVLIRWLDFSDTTFVGGHPSDCIGALLAAADHASRLRLRQGTTPWRMADVFGAMVGAYEIQGLLAADNRFDSPAIGLDHVIGVKLASTAFATRLLGGDVRAIAAALSNAFLDGQPLNAYRHVPNAGSRKGWAGGDAAARGVALALDAVRGEMGYPRPLSAPTWGFEAVHMNGRPVRLTREPGSFVIDHVIFKLHACQRNTTTAVESALQLHAWLDGRPAERIRRVAIRTQDEAIRRTDKTGPLPNRAARDHSIQYVVAVALRHGRLTPEDYADEIAADPLIDGLRERTTVSEDLQFTREHHDAAIRSCASAVRIELDDGSVSPWITTRFPAGDPSRRGEALLALRAKFIDLTRRRWNAGQQQHLLGLLLDAERLKQMPVPDFMDLLADP